MPKVARALGLIVPNHGMFADVALVAVGVQVEPLALSKFTVKSTLPLLPLPGALNLTPVLPALIVPPPVSVVSHAARLFL